MHIFFSLRSFSHSSAFSSLKVKPPRDGNCFWLQHWQSHSWGKYHLPLSNIPCTHCNQKHKCFIIFFPIYSTVKLTFTFIEFSTRCEQLTANHWAIFTSYYMYVCCTTIGAQYQFTKELVQYKFNNLFIICPGISVTLSIQVDILPFWLC